MKKITLAYFSPGGSTKEVAEIFASAITNDIRHIDLMKNPLAETETFRETDILVVVMPVFAGRIPSVCPEMLRKLKGAATSAVTIAVYGNRDFDDALIEMSDILQENGFNIVGAAAFIARHSIFPNVAKNRPDENDKEEIKRFAEDCSKKVEKQPAYSTTFKIPGNRPYQEAAHIPMRPTGKKSTCTGCNICVNICPMQAINSDFPTKTDKTKCITCMACVYHCPVKSRGLHTPLYNIAKGSFEKKCATRKEPTVLV